MSGVLASMRLGNNIMDLHGQRGIVGTVASNAIAPS
jgi:hypothetical protein